MSQILQHRYILFHTLYKCHVSYVNDWGTLISLNRPNKKFKKKETEQKRKQNLPSTIFIITDILHLEINEIFACKCWLPLNEISRTFAFYSVFKRLIDHIAHSLENIWSIPNVFFRFVRILVHFIIYYSRLREF